MKKLIQQELYELQFINKLANIACVIWFWYSSF